IVKATFALLTGFSTFINLSYSQQNIIADKDNTRPETAPQYAAAGITSFSATRFNGYNEIQWSAVSEEQTRKFIVEYSSDGINFQTAGEMVPADHAYSLKHYTFDQRPLLYRIRMEKLDGKFANSGSILLDGTDIPPVKIYPTVVNGDVINMNT